MKNIGLGSAGLFIGLNVFGALMFKKLINYQEEQSKLIKLYNLINKNLYYYYNILII